MKHLIRILLVVLVVGGAYGAFKYFQQLPQKQSPVAITKARQGDVIVRAFSRGELRAVRSVILYAPNLFSTVQVTRLAPLGALAKEKDLIVEFDDSERRSQLEETLLEVEQIDEQMKKSQADIAIRTNQDQVELLRARYAVRRAELEVQRNALLSEIDAKKNLLNREEANRRLKQLESDIKSRQDQAQAEIAVLRERRNKSMIDVGREQQRIAQTKILSPITGLVAIKQNRGMSMMFGQQLPDIREGDTLQPGTPVAEVLDLSELEVIAKVGELDRANLREGQDVNIQLDAVPEKVFHGKIKAMSATASSNPFAGDPAKKFDVIFSVDMKELMTGLGATPDQIRRVMETAAQNAKKGVPAQPTFSMPMMAGGAPGAPAMGGMPGGAPGAAGGMMVVGPNAPGAPGGQGGGQGGRGGGGGMSDEQRRTMMAAMITKMLESLPAPARKEVQAIIGKKNVADLSNEDRQKVMAKLREIAQSGSVPGMQFGGGRGEGGGGRGEGGGGRGEGGGGRGEGGGRRGGGEGGPRAMSAEEQAAAKKAEDERNNAKLPLPPEEDSQLDVLLRPGLLADVEIIVDKVANALHIPSQAVFEKDGKPYVYVQNTQGRFEERLIKPAKRSESVVVIAEGLKPGETVALGDPTAKRSGSQDKKGEKGGTKAMGGMPGGGGGPKK